MKNKRPQALLLFSQNSALANMRELLKSEYTDSVILYDNNKPEQITPEEKYPVIVLDIVNNNLQRQLQFMEICKRRCLKNSILIVLCDEDDANALSPDLLEQATIFLHHPVYETGLSKIIEDCLSKFQENLSVPRSENEMINVIKTMDKGEFTFQRLDEAQSLSTALANLCPNAPEVAIGLLELMINGIEHGNLAISFDEKGALLEEGRWHEEIDHRLSLPEYSTRKAHILYQRTPEKIEFVISDDGPGFDVSLYLPGEPLNPPAGAHHKFHGRGIMLAAQLCFDHLEYFGKGNQVKATIDL